MMDQDGEWITNPDKWDMSWAEEHRQRHEKESGYLYDRQNYFMSNHYFSPVWDTFEHREVCWILGDKIEFLQVGSVRQTDPDKLEGKFIFFDEDLPSNVNDSLTGWIDHNLGRTGFARTIGRRRNTVQIITVRAITIPEKSWLHGRKKLL